MSDFLNKLTETINKGVDTLTTKSKTLYETTKLRNEISGMVKQKKQLLFEAGRKAYELSKTGEWATTELDVFFEEVMSIEKLIEEKNKEIDRIYEEEKMQKAKTEEAKKEDDSVIDTTAEVKHPQDSMVYHDEDDEEISFVDDDKE